MGITNTQIVNKVATALGDPYVYGAEGPTQFDCSGLIQWALKGLGVKGVPRTSEQQYAWTRRVSASQLQAGDLIFTQWPGDGASPGHVALYAGNGYLIEAPRPGKNVQRVPFNSTYKAHVVGYGRIPGLGTATGTGVEQVDDVTGSTTVSAGYLSSVGGWLSQLGGGGLSDTAAVIGQVFTPMGNFFTDLGHALEVWMHAALWLVNPMNWLRIVAGVTGAVFFVTGAALVAQSA